MVDLAVIVNLTNAPQPLAATSHANKQTDRQTLTVAHAYCGSLHAAPDRRSQFPRVGLDRCAQAANQSMRAPRAYLECIPHRSRPDAARGNARCVPLAPVVEAPISLWRPSRVPHAGLRREIVVSEGRSGLCDRHNHKLQRGLFVRHGRDTHAPQTPRTLSTHKRPGTA